MAKVTLVNMGAYRRFSPYIWAPGRAYLGPWEGLFGTPYGPGPGQSQGHLNVPQAGLAQIALPEGPPGGAQIGGLEALFGPRYGWI